jgi:hypothetical protein
MSITNSSRWTTSSGGRERAARARANGGAPSQHKKEAQTLDRQSAVADYDAARRAQRENMERLKALRLAREAAEALCAPVEAAPARPKRRTSKTAGGAQPVRGSTKNA